MAINISDITMATTFWGWTGAINNTTNQLIGVMILVSLFFIIFMGSLAFGKKVAFSSAGLISGLIGIAFWVTKFVPSWIGVIFMLLFIGSLLGATMGDGS